MRLNVYSFNLYNVDIYIINYSAFIYKVLFIIYNKLFKNTYINYNIIELFKRITFNNNIYK
jgi:hypothetical protein